MARWVLHIGAPKTGSTALQRLLFENRARLLERGVLYPDVSLRGYGHHDLAFLLGGGYPAWASPQKRPLRELVVDLRRDVAAHPSPTIVLSSEDFYLFPAPEALLAAMQEGGFGRADHAQVVCYVRRQDEAHVSWYNQTVKAQGNAGSLPATIASSRDLWDYAERLRPWRKVFGADAVLVRDYAPFAAGRADICADFLQLLGLEAGAFDTKSGRANERINRDLLEMQRLVNRLPLPTRWKRHYHRQLIALSASPAAQEVFDDGPLLGDAEAAALRSSYEDSNREVARRYLGRERLFAEPLVRAPASAAAPVALTFRKILFTLRWLWLNKAR